ncbi:hypothetical protein FIP36_16755 [Salmonella enterica]|nr:hypothetical protein [Salmonella enterica]
MKTKLAYSKSCSDSIYAHIYSALRSRAGEENERLYQESISKCRTPKQIKQKAGYYAGAWQKLFNAWCDNRIPNIAVLQLLPQQHLSFEQCDDLIASWN